MHTKIFNSSKSQKFEFGQLSIPHFLFVLYSIFERDFQTKQLLQNLPIENNLTSNIHKKYTSI